MAITFNLDEYVSATLEAMEGEPISNHDMAMSIADTVCGQGLYDPQSDAEFDLLVKEITDALPYYTGKGS